MLYWLFAQISHNIVSYLQNQTESAQILLPCLGIIGQMLHYNWNDLMISAQLFKMKIVISAMPTNITNLNIDSEEVQRIQKAFEGEITQSLIKVYIGEDKKQIREIQPFYDYMRKCFNEASLREINQIDKDSSYDKIKVLRQWSIDQATNSKKQRLIIKISLQGAADGQVKQQSEPYEFVVKLKEVYLSLNSLLLKTNTIILAQLDYYKDAEKRNQDKMLQIRNKLEDKMSQQLSTMKKQMQDFISNFMNKSNFDTDTEPSTRNKKHKKKNAHQKSKEVKYEQSNEEQEPKKRRSSKINNKSPQYIKVEQAQTKFEDDEQSRRLRKLQEQQPKQRIIQMPIQYDQQNPAYHFFAYSKRSVTKIGGFDYPMIILKNIIPAEGTHGVITKYVIEKKAIRCCCIQVGIIDQNVKQSLHSSVCDNYVKFKMNVSTVFTKVKGKQSKKKHGKMRILKPGESIELKVNLSLGIISWTASYGEVVRAEIPKQLLSMKLQAFVGIYTTGDTIQFQEYPLT